MIHLFNKVYLEFDSYNDQKRDRIIVSKTLGTQFDTSVGKIIYETNELTNVTNDFPSFIEKAKSSDGVVMVYADKEAFIAILTRWVKAITASCDKETFNSFIKLSLFKIRALDKDTLSGNLSDYTIDLPTVDQFSTEFDSVDISIEDSKKIRTNISQYSYEFLLATYLTDQLCYSTEFKNTLLNLLKRQTKETISEVKTNINLNIMNIHFQEAFGYSDDYVDFSLNNPGEKITSLGIFYDSDLWREKSSKSYDDVILENVDSAKSKLLIESVFKYLTTFSTSVFSDKEYYEKTFLLAYQKSLSDEDTNWLLNFISNAKVESNFIGQYDLNNINAPLVSWIVNNNKKSQKDLFKNLSLKKD